MKLFWDLSVNDREYHLSIAKTLIAGNVYKFTPPIRSVPLEHWLKGSPYWRQMIKVNSGEFIYWRGGKSRFQDCLFSVQVAHPIVEQFEYIVPLLFHRETMVELI